MNNNAWGSPTTYTSYYWWNAPVGMTDYDFYDYNGNWVLDDNEIADLVRDNIFSDPGITYTDANNIDVNVRNGVVTLNGEVTNPRTVPLAYADAYWGSGVTDVDNKLKVKQRSRRQQQDQNQGQGQGQSRGQNR